MFEMIPDAAVVMFARLPQGDGVFLWNSSAQDEVVEKKKRAVVEGKKKTPVSISTYLWKHLTGWTQRSFNGGHA